MALTREVVGALSHAELVQLVLAQAAALQDASERRFGKTPKVLLNRRLEDDAIGRHPG